MMKIEILLDRIKAVYPEFIIEKAEMNMNGQNNHVIIINDMYVFRFPKYQEGIESLKLEVTLLKNLYNRFSIPIPHPEFVILEETEIGKAFAGYRMLEGQPMRADEIAGTERTVLIKLAKQLTAFLESVHSIPMDLLDTVIVQANVDPVIEIESLYSNLKNKVFNYMSTKAKNTVSLNFESFIRKQKNQLTPTLIHGDFGASNLLWNPEKSELSGVVDFGAARLGDPAYDFAGLLSCYGEEFFSLCLQNYPGGAGLLERVKFYRSTFALQEALHGIENNDEQAFKNGIRTYL
jgi:aminoglycoside 2''-phosphotransferase